ncbi:MAG: LacI family transcriptional regulator, partial [Acetatifactor sp.]|nr:LacI family transcriptional regulator [Acetatifactor sp.]
MPKRPTLKTIAQRAGLSHVAVSKALRDASDISAETKERVKQIANDLGYTTNITARNLYLRRSSAIGMIVPAMGGNTAYDLVFNGISAAAMEHEFCVMLGSSQRSVSQEEKHCRIMVGNQVGAIIVAPCTSDVSHIKTICGSTPVIFIGGKAAQEETNSILCDYRHSGTQAVEYLADKLGHKNIM